MDPNVLVGAPLQALAAMYPKILGCSGGSSNQSPLLHLSPNPASSQKAHQMMTPPEMLKTTPIGHLN